MSRNLHIVLLCSALALTPALGLAHDGHDHSADEKAAAVKGGSATIGSLEITGAYSRATLPRAPVGGGYFTVKNTGDAADRLVSVTAPVGKEVQIHEMAMVEDVMRMRQLTDGLELPAQSEIAFAPGGYHLMIMGLTAPLVEGEVVELELRFEKAGLVKVPFEIKASNAKPGDAPCEHNTGDEGHGDDHGDHHGQATETHDKKH